MLTKGLKSKPKLQRKKARTKQGRLPLKCRRIQCVISPLNEMC